MRAVTRRALAEFPDRLEAHFGAFPETHWMWTPASWEGCPSEHFTALEQLCHVRDVEIDGYHVRFRRALAEDNPFLPDVGGYALRDARAYAHTDPAAALAAFRVARAETLALLDALDDDAFARPVFFEDYGDTTLRGLTDFLASHDHQHLAGLHWLLGQSAKA